MLPGFRWPYFGALEFYFGASEFVHCKCRNNRFLNVTWPIGKVASWSWVGGRGGVGLGAGVGFGWELGFGARVRGGVWRLER